MFKTNTYLFSKKGDSNKRYSNVIDLCFFDKACIARREAANAIAQQQIAEQQAILLNISSQKVGGLTATGYAGIITAILLVSATVVLIIKKRKKATS